MNARPRPKAGEPNGMMKTLDHRYRVSIRAIAVCLLIVFISVTTFANLFHNHKSLERLPDCPACLWLQISQEVEDGPTAAELIASSLVLTDETPPLNSGYIRVTCDVSIGTPIRAPPAL